MRDREDASVPELIAHVRELFRKNTKSRFHRYLFGKEKLKPTREEAFSNEVDPTDAAHYLDRLGRSMARAERRTNASRSGSSTAIC